VHSRKIEVGGIILGTTRPKSWMKRLKRKLRKIAYIGPLGALNGLRLRRWYRDENMPDVRSLARDYGVPVYETTIINSEETQNLFRHVDADLGLSLGSPYISKEVFSIPSHGMVNVHGEVLPDFRGGQSVIWPIHEGRTETGFTIHEINKDIDEGRILYQETFPMEWEPTLKETVVETLKKTRVHISPAMRFVCEHYEELVDEAAPQGPGKSFTTPSIWEFVRMLRNHRTFYQEQTS